MGKPDFIKHEVYKLKIIDKDNNELYSGQVNKKAWEKSIETGKLWELTENGRVIEKEIDEYDGVGKKISIENGQIIIKLTMARANISNEVESNPNMLTNLEDLIKKRKYEMPDNSYTTHLFKNGADKILKKMGEETIEVILAKNNRVETIKECADLVYHLLVYLVNQGIEFKEVLDELKERH